MWSCFMLSSATTQQVTEPRISETHQWSCVCFNIQYSTSITALEMSRFLHFPLQKTQISDLYTHTCIAVCDTKLKPIPFGRNNDTDYILYKRCFWILLLVIECECFITFVKQCATIFNTWFRMSCEWILSNLNEEKKRLPRLFKVMHTLRFVRACFCVFISAPTCDCTIIHTAHLRCSWHGGPLYTELLFYQRV